MMKKLRTIIPLCIMLIILTSCNLGMDDNGVVESDENEGETFIIPNNKVSEAEYQMILPFRPREARGLITNQVVNRDDIEELEDGLRRHYTDTFNPEDYVDEEGQYFTANEIYSLIDEIKPKIKKKKKEKDRKSVV